MKRIILTLSFSFIIILFSAFGQKRSELKALFVEAESYFLFEEYNEALPIYLKLTKTDPENANLKYRIGRCYLNLPGEKNLSLSYLQEAVKNITLKYKEGSFREKEAPNDAYYYLADAYRINNKLDKAIDTYNYFKENSNEKDYDFSVIDYQIQTCYNAKKLMQRPLYIKYTNLGENINSRFSDYNPIVSGDENTLIFTRKLQFYDAVFYSVKKNGDWAPPSNLTPELSVDQDFYSTSISYDGKRLYLYKNDEYDGNIYQSELINGKWNPVVRLNNNINTKYWESHACETKDGNTLYFTSNRKGGFGGLDIYKSEKDEAGNWGPPVNMGPSINTEYNEDTPFITPDGKTLYFSSYGHFSMGGYDIFYSSLFENGEWSTPLNMGYPINSTDDDLFYMPTGEGYFAYYSMFSEAGYGKKDIFHLEIYSDEHPRKFLVHGLVSLDRVIQGSLTPILVTISDSDNNEPVDSMFALSDGKYSFLVSAGNYELKYKADGFQSESKKITVSADQEESDISMSATQLMLMDLTADIEFLDSSINLLEDTIIINLSVEPGAILLVEVFEDTNLISSEEYYMTDSIFEYRYVSEPGQKDILFTLTDKPGNTKTVKRIIAVPYVVPFTKTEEEPDIPLELSVFKVPEDVITFRNRINSYAQGPVKTEIQGIDLAEEEISHPKELVSLLKSNGSKAGYSGNDIDDLLWTTAARGDNHAGRFIRYMKESTPHEFGGVLDTIDFNDSKIRTIEDIRSLISTQVDAGMLAKEMVLNGLIKIILADQVVDFHNNLDQAAQGHLKDVLSSIDTEEKGIYSSYELVKFLLDNAELLDFTEEELAILLAKLAANGNPDVHEFKTNLTPFTSRGLKTCLYGLDLNEEKINTIPEFIKYLLNNQGKCNYTATDLFNALIDMISETDIDMNKVKDIIIEEGNKTDRGKKIFYWLSGLAGLFLIFLLYRRRKKKKEGE
jgi:hypothetical protein